VTFCVPDCAIGPLASAPVAASSNETTTTAVRFMAFSFSVAPQRNVGPAVGVPRGCSGNSEITNRAFGGEDRSVAQTAINLPKLGKAADVARV
jgi:hypothetical protein